MKLDRTDEQILEVVKDEQFVTATELLVENGGPLDMTRQSANRRLRDLYERGVLDRKRSGSGHGYWLSEEFEDVLDEI